jgi:hypothetical protein
MSETFGGPVVGTCARHSGQAAAQTCPRCGNFMCALCTDGGRQELCPACRVRTGASTFPFNRGSWDFGSLWSYCSAQFQREWVMLSLCALIFFVVVGGAQFVGTIFQTIAQATESIPLLIAGAGATIVLQYAAQGVMTVGMMHLVFNVLNGGKADVGMLFAQMHKAGRYILAMLLVFVIALVPIALFFGVGFGLVTAVGGIETPAAVLILVVLSLVFIVAALYFGLPLLLLGAEIAFTDETSPMQLLKNCFAIANGERLSLLGVFIVTILLMVLGVFACCVGVLPASALANLLTAGLYLALRNGAPLPDANRFDANRF